MNNETDKKQCKVARFAGPEAKPWERMAQDVHAVEEASSLSDQRGADSGFELASSDEWQGPTRGIQGAEMSSDEWKGTGHASE
eukprot:561737-Pelagomonas_calceolata.AAC.3